MVMGNATPGPLGVLHGENRLFGGRHGEEDFSAKNHMHSAVDSEHRSLGFDTSTDMTIKGLLAETKSSGTGPDSRLNTSLDILSGVHSQSTKQQLGITSGYSP